MPMTVDEIVAETREMPQAIRAELVERILLAAHSGLDQRVEEAWTTETRRRVDEIESGKTAGIPLDEALTEMRKRLDS